ncbi:hypothetical protein ACS5PU_01310 [Pedobacter sp. GSP4]|uniref:hypothetical protein n=1 Tax=Pedobacter sp. GSP4 TaxID=3453716 RepID=UPI003EEE7809
MKKLELSKFGVQEMDAKEMINQNGGMELPKWIKGLGWGYLVTEAVEHWADIKRGFAEGYNAQL